MQHPLFFFSIGNPEPYLPSLARAVLQLKSEERLIIIFYSFIRSTESSGELKAKQV